MSMLQQMRSSSMTPRKALLTVSVFVLAMTGGIFLLVRMMTGGLSAATITPAPHQQALLTASAGKSYSGSRESAAMAE